MYCGMIGSSISVAAGMPSSATFNNRRRALRMPAGMSLLPSRRGSLMSPFQPTVVRGFSK